MNYKVRTWMNYNFKDHSGEVNLLPSETIPDQSLTIKEIVGRYVRGLPITGSIPVYDDDDDVLNEVVYPDITKMDLADLQQMKEDNQQWIAKLNKELKDKSAQIKSKLNEHRTEKLQKETKQQSNQSDSKSIKEPVSGSPGNDRPGSEVKD